MKHENISKVIGSINEKYIIEAENYSSKAKRYCVKSFLLKHLLQLVCFYVC